MTTVKPKLRLSSAQDRPGTIVYIVTKDREAHMLTTTHRLFPYEWNKARGAVIPSLDERLLAIDRHIRHDLRRLERVIHRFESNRENYTAEQVIQTFLFISENGSFFRLMKSVTERYEQLNRKGTARNYRAALSSFRCFRLDEDVDIDDMDTVLMEDYEAWLRSNGLTPNTTSFYMRILRAVYNKAVQRELCTDRHPFRTVFTGMEKTRKRALSVREIKRIHSLELSSFPQLEFARDLFFFLFYCRGMSFVDAAYLKKSDIRCGILTYRRKKTYQLLHIRVLPEMRRIIKRYTKLDSIFLFPFIYPLGDERKQYETALHRINRSLRIIGMMAGLKIPLTTYVSRHSWATIARGKHVPLPIISEALGHDSENTTQIYLASIDSSMIDRANKLVVGTL